jgi:hypothetical protein
MAGPQTGPAIRTKILGGIRFMSNASTDTAQDMTTGDQAARPAGPVCGNCRHGSCAAITPQVPCAKGCGELTGRGTKTGLCVRCVRDAWRTGELAHPRNPNHTQRRETPAYAANLRSMTRALGVRIGAGADIENLGELAALRAETERVEKITVAVLREQHGYSWADIGRQLGITRQAAQLRFGKGGA